MVETFNGIMRTCFTDLSVEAKTPTLFRVRFDECALQDTDEIVSRLEVGFHIAARKRGLNGGPVDKAGAW